MAYPPDSLQGLLGETWWEPYEGKVLCPGQLVWTEVCFYSQIPFQLTVQRADEQDHRTAEVRAQAMKISGRRAPWPDLPVAGLPRLDGADCFLIQRAKVRPCLVLGGIDARSIPDTFRKKVPNWVTTQHCLVAPFYSADQHGRAGYPPAFVEKIRHGTYSQFFADTLPMKNGSQDSILRFDQCFPMGMHPDAYGATGYRLHDRAWEVLKEWFAWYVDGVVIADSMLEFFFLHIQETSQLAKGD